MPARDVTSAAGAVTAADLGFAEQPMPLAQQRLWLLEQIGAVGKAYHMTRWMHLRGPLDREALGRALDRLMARHESLRTTFHSVAGEPVQRVVSAEVSRFEVVEHDLRSHPHPEAERDRLMAMAADEDFDLERGPLIRGHLIRLPDDRHTLVFPAHHIVCDAWSVGVFDHDLSALYGAFARGEADPLPPLPVQYAQYEAAQRSALSGDELRRQADYWKETLAGAPRLLTVPADRPRPAEQDITAGYAALELDEALTAALKALSRRHETTLFTTLIAAWAVVLGRLSGQDDVVIGTPTANRKRREVLRMIGFLVNTLAVRVELGGSPTVAELLRRVKARAQAAQRHQDIPFEQVVELLQPERTTEHSPIFQVLFTWQNAFRDPPGLPGLTLDRAGWAQHETALFDLALTLQEVDGRIAGGIKYAAALFERETVARYLGYLHRVLEGMAAGDDTPVDRIPLLPPEERGRMLDAWNDTETAGHGDLCLHELFQARAARTPDAVAVEFEEQSLTWAELNARANRLAHHLRGLGVRPDTRVAVCAERSPELMVALLAVLKAGGAYVPLDPEYPAERLRYMLHDSAPVAMLVHRAPAELSAGAGVPRLELRDGASAWAGEPEADPPLDGLCPRHLAYVIYTSGSTGRPKGVMVEHRGVVNVLGWMHETFGPDAGGAVLQKTPVSFDASVRELFSPMLAGARLVVARPGGHRDAAYLAETVRRTGVDTLHFVPAMLQAFVEQPEAGDCSGVRRIVCGGQALSAALVRQLRARLPRATLFNVYGPTEAAVDVTAWRCAPDPADAVVPIGRPMANTRIYVLDAADEPVPARVAGEIHIGGAQVARGYLGRPALTAERFVPDPFSREPGARLYRTGDLGRWGSDGALHFAGRNDHQVKVRGFRIELGEIEARLAEHPAVRGAVVMAREDVPGDVRLAAYYVGAPGEAEALRAHLGALLPEHMVPAAFVPLDALPLTPNGKVDRGALQAPDSAAYGERAHEPPVGETESALAEIWSEVLGVERIGRQDHFFDLGGHSLLALKLIARMRRRGLRVEPAVLFGNPTLAELAAALATSPGAAAKAVEAKTAEAKAPDAGRIPAGCTSITPDMLPLVRLSAEEIGAIVAGVPGGAANVQDIYPLAPLQEGVLFHHLLAVEGDPYLLPILFRMDTRARVDAFVGALRAIVARHDVLRTAVAWEGLPEPVQVVWREAPLTVEEVDIDPGAGDAAGELLRRFDPARYRIDVRRAPLMRVQVAREAAHGRWLVLLLRHHLVTDHTTAEVLLAELRAYLSGRAESLPAAVPFRDFVARARQGVSRAEHEAFFTAMLGAVTEPTAPFGLVDAPGAGQAAEARLEMDPSLAARLREGARRAGVSAATVCHLAWALVLARTSGRSDVVFGTVLFGRMGGGEGAERALGPFMNTLPIRIDVDGDGAASGVRRTQEALAGLLRHEHASLALAQRCSGVQAPAPLFTSLLNYRHGTAERDARSAGGLVGWDGIQVIHADGRTHFPLTLSVDDLGDGFWITAQAADPVSPQRLCALMETALARLVDTLERAPGTPLAGIDILPAAERRQVLEAWNATDAAYPAEACVHELFERQAARAPVAAAVMHEERSLTYAELNAQANRLAHALRDAGVAPGARVAVLVPRSIELVVSELGVLKTGAAYVPIDPAFPAERLAYMVADSGSRVVLALAGADLPDLPEVERIDVDALAEGRTDDPRVPLDGEAAAYVMYTSGSTGQPKGVVVPHRAISRLVVNSGYADFVAGDRVAFAANPAFDASTMEVWGPLLNGGRIVVIGQDVLLDPRRFGEAL
ncbi:MAG TPA: amino acid adenylation domain-containing protein, partial [Longimicrobium sp.]|nr:amino acid adenylation domain-containing protein [Longimicrobium sp.]